MDISLNLLDIGIIAAIGLALARGLRNGVLLEAGGIVGLLAALHVAYRFCGDIGDLLGRFEPISRWKQETAFILLLLAGIIAVHLLVNLLRPLAGRALSGSLNTIFGAALGALRGALLCSLALLFFKWIVPHWPLLKESRLQVWLIPLLAQVRFMLHW